MKKMRNQLRKSRLLPFATLIIFAVSYADPPTGLQPNTQDNSQQELLKEIQILGNYFGYDLTKKPPQFTDMLFDKPPLIAGLQLFSPALFLGLTPTGTAILPQELLRFISQDENFPTIFSNIQYSNTASAGSGMPSIIPLIDQAPYQPEPVSQGIVNMLSTPDFSFCYQAMSGSTNTEVPPDFLQNCKQSRYQNLISYHTLGQIPQPNTLFDIKSLDPNLIQELNSNTLITPLVYDTNPPKSNEANKQTDGLSATTQAQQAANFIRYVTGSIMPVPQPLLSTYNQVLTTATTPPNPKDTPDEQTIDRNKQLDAIRTLTTFVGGMRVLTAQTSVAYSNLYYILSKRMPQKLVDSSSAPANAKSSEALNEYIMATRRLFNPTKIQWEDQINTASAATVQKEIATLLAEINYQLYLNRMQEERILLTNSILVLQNAKMSQPDPTLGAGQ